MSKQAGSKRGVCIKITGEMYSISEVWMIIVYITNVRVDISMDGQWKYRKRSAWNGRSVESRTLGLYLYFRDSNSRSVNPIVLLKLSNLTNSLGLELPFGLSVEFNRQQPLRRYTLVVWLSAAVVGCSNSCWVCISHSSCRAVCRRFGFGFLLRVSGKVLICLLFLMSSSCLLFFLVRGTVFIPCNSRQ